MTGMVIILFNICSNNHPIVGRNFGNISFNSFAQREEQYEVDEAIRSCVSEFYSTLSTVDISERYSCSEGICMGCVYATICRRVLRRVV